MGIHPARQSDRVYYTCKYAIPDLKTSGGHIIVIGSGMGHRDGNAGSAYSVSKAGVWMLVRNLATELRPHGICVNELIPGLVDTDILTDSERPANPALSLEWFKQPNRCRAARAFPGEAAAHRSHRSELQLDAPRLAVVLLLHFGKQRLEILGFGETDRMIQRMRSLV